MIWRDFKDSKGLIDILMDFQGFEGFCVVLRNFKGFEGISRDYKEVQGSLGVPSKKKNSIFTDIVQIGGGEVNPNSKFFCKIIF